MLIALLAAIPTALVLAPDSFLFMLVRSFLRQWVFVFAVLAIFFLIRRWVWPAIMSVGATLLIAAQVPWPADTVNDHAGGGHLMRIGQFNVLQPNGSKGAIIRAARASGADVLSFQEVDRAWATALDQALCGEFPYRLIVPRNDCYGIALFSRLPVDTMEVIDLLGAPAVCAKVRIGTDRVAVTAVHARSPLPYAAFVKRNRQFGILADRPMDGCIPQLLIGDFNAVSWDEAFVGLRERMGLHSAPAREQATFPSILGLAMIPIDHILASTELTIGNVSTQHLVGSDHRALIADIGLRTP